MVTMACNPIALPGPRLSGVIANPLRSLSCRTRGTAMTLRPRVPMPLRSGPVGRDVPPEKPARILLVGTGAVWHPYSKPGIVAEHLQAAHFFAQLGMNLGWTAYAFGRWPQLGDMEPAELQARADALLAAFGGGLSAAELRWRLCARPGLLVLSPKKIAAVQAWLARLGLAKGEVAVVLASEPTILMASAAKMRKIASELRSHYKLSPEQLRSAVVEMPRVLSPTLMAAGFNAKVMQQLEDVMAKQHQQSS